MISLKQINSKYVRAIPIPDEDTRPMISVRKCLPIYFCVLRKRVGRQVHYLKL